MFQYSGALGNVFREKGNLKRYDKQAVITPADFDVRQLYMVTGGCLKIFVASKQCEEFVHIGFLQPGDILGEQGLFDSHQTDPFAAVSYQPRNTVTLRAVNHKDVLKASKKSPELVSEIARHINERLALTTNRLSQLLFMGIDERAYECLLSISKLPEAMTHPLGTLIRVTRIELSQMINCSRETAGRSVQRMVALGLIEAKGQKILLKGIRNGERVDLSDFGNSGAVH